jgi:hypothetical protein
MKAEPITAAGDIGIKPPDPAASCGLAETCESGAVGETAAGGALGDACPSTGGAGGMLGGRGKPPGPAV